MQKQVTQLGDLEAALGVRNEIAKLKAEGPPLLTDSKIIASPIVLRQLVGRWKITYMHRHVRVYEIQSNGKVRFESDQGPKGDIARFPGRFGVIKMVKGDITIDFDDGKIERVTLVNGRLLVEHFSPADTFPDAVPDQMGVGRRLPEE